MRRIEIRSKESHHPLWGGRRLAWVFDEFALDTVGVEIRPDALDQLSDLFEDEAAPGRYLTDERAEWIEGRVRSMFAVESFTFENDWELRDPARLVHPEDPRVRRLTHDDVPAIERHLQRAGHAERVDSAQVLAPSIVFGCFVGEDLAGRAAIHDHADDRSEIISVYTVPAERCCGIGTALVVACAPYSRKAGLPAAAQPSTTLP